MNAPIEPGITRRVLREWSLRAGSEYGSGVVAQHFSLWLMQLGAPVELVRAGMDVVDDELDHAHACRTLLRSLGHDDVPVLHREHLELPRTPDAPLEHDLVRACIAAFCVDETIAVTLFRVMRDSATVDRIVELAEVFLRDEVRHRELGWVTLEWLLQGSGGDALRAIARECAPRMLAQRGAKMCVPSPAAVAPPTAAERAWGILAREQYREVFARACERDVVPRFARLGITVP